ncbi:MAG TPA: HAD-IA family hydrolase [Cellvibrionaceae bacterium]
MPLRALLFDLDGTLLDTSGDMGAALNGLLAEQGRAQLTAAQIRPHVSNGANALIKLGFGEITASDHEALRARFLDLYLANIASHTVPFEGIETLLTQCAEHNIAWGIATNKPWRYTEPLMRHFSFASSAVVTFCPEHAKPKPDPSMLLLACEHIKCAPVDAIYIGDHQRDIECGRLAGMPTIAVGYGFTQSADEHTQWDATFAVDSAHDIWPLIQKHYL